MNFSNIAQQYQEACQAVQKAVKASKYKPTWFIQQLGFGKSPSAFYKRLAEGSWTPEQLANIGLLLEGKSVITD